MGTFAARVCNGSHDNSGKASKENALCQKLKANQFITMRLNTIIKNSVKTRLWKLCSVSLRRPDPMQPRLYCHELWPCHVRPSQGEESCWNVRSFCSTREAFIWAWFTITIFFLLWNSNRMRSRWVPLNLSCVYKYYSDVAILNLPYKTQGHMEEWYNVLLGVYSLI